MKGVAIISVSSTEISTKSRQLPYLYQIKKTMESPDQQFAANQIFDKIKQCMKGPTVVQDPEWYRNSSYREPVFLNQTEGLPLSPCNYPIPLHVIRWPCPNRTHDRAIVRYREKNESKGSMYFSFTLSLVVRMYVVIVGIQQRWDVIWEDYLDASAPESKNFIWLLLTLASLILFLLLLALTNQCPVILEQYSVPQHSGELNRKRIKWYI